MPGSWRWNAASGCQPDIAVGRGGAEAQRMRAVNPGMRFERSAVAACDADCNRQVDTESSGDYLRRERATEARARSAKMSTSGVECPQPSTDGREVGRALAAGGGAVRLCDPVD